MLEQVAEGGRRRRSAGRPRSPLWVWARTPFVARGAGGGDQRVGGEVLGQRRRLLGGGDQVDVLAGLGPAPGRAGDLDPVGGRVLAQRRRQLLGDRRHLGEQQRGPGPRPARRAARARRARSPRPSAPRPLTLADLLRLGRGLEVLQRGDAELVEEQPRGFRAEARHPGHLDQRRRELRLQLHRGGDLAGLEQRRRSFPPASCRPRGSRSPGPAAASSATETGLSRIALAACCRRARGI